MPIRDFPRWSRTCYWTRYVALLLATRRTFWQRISFTSNTPQSMWMTSIETWCGHKLEGRRKFWRPLESGVHKTTNTTYSPQLQMKVWYFCDFRHLFQFVLEECYRMWVTRVLQGGGIELHGGVDRSTEQCSALPQCSVSTAVMSTSHQFHLRYGQKETEMERHGLEREMSARLAVDMMRLSCSEESGWDEKNQFGFPGAELSATLGIDGS